MKTTARSKAPANKHKLTDIYIHNLKPSDRTRMVWDTVQPGFGVQITPFGVKSFKVVYRFQHRPRWFHIGRYGKVGLKDARKKAQKVLGEIEEPSSKNPQGHDPQGVKMILRRGETLKQVAEQYVERHARHKNKSWRESDKLMKRYVFPSLGTRKITEIMRRDVRRLFEHLTYDKKRPPLANQVLAAISAVFTWADEQEIVNGNPARGIKRNSLKGVERYLSDDEVKSVWAKFEDLGFHSTMALRLILLTAQRPGEVVRMRWEDIDLKACVWTLSGDPVGTWPGTKNKRTHDVPLAPQAIAILDELEPQEDGPVFPPRMAIPVTKAVWQALDIPRFRPHDLRATAASGMDFLGIHKEHIAKVLNHLEGGVTAGYIRHDHMDQKRRALEAWGSHLMEVVEGRTPESRVVDIRSGKAGSIAAPAPFGPRDFP